MPIYEYECPKCGERFDVMQKVSDPPLKKCKKCNKTGVRKLLGTPALQFKGSGWYITDYAGKSPAPEGAQAADTKSDSGDKKTETKTDSGTDTKSAPSCACSAGGCAH